MGVLKRRKQARTPPAAHTSTTQGSSSKDIPEPPSGRWQVVVVAVLLVSCKYAVQMLMGPRTYISCRAEQPLYYTSPDFLPESEFLALKEEVDGHHYMGDNALNAENFQKTEGFVVKFNREGISRLRSDPALGALSNYFDRVRDPLANAWVLNVLLCNPVEEGEGKGEGEDDLAVSPHVDETLGTRSRDSFLAHVVNVLYVSLPEDMTGGRLEMYGYNWLRVKLFPYLLTYLPTAWLNRLLPPDAWVKPVENLLVSFRGDTIHRVEGYRTGNNGEGGDEGKGDVKYGKSRRVSVVLEQYSVPLLSYRFTFEYDLSSGNADHYSRGVKA